MKNKTNLGDFLRDKRKSSKLTLKDVTSKMGWSVVYLSDIERGRRNPPSNDRLLEISKILKINFDDLLNLANEERGKIELCLHDKSVSVSKAALSLSRSWEGISDSEANEITKILSNDK